MNKEKFKAYADMKAQKVLLEEQLREMEEEIKNEMGDADKVNTDFGTFSVSIRTTYTYSDKVDTLKQALKDQKEREEMQDIAEVKSEKKVLIFRKVK